jgi:transcriptional regulator with XRE-family HTH domain
MTLTVPDERRVRTVLAWMGLSVEKCARQAGISTRYLWLVLKGEYIPSQAFLRRLRQAMGDAAWSFATGASDSLPANNEPPKKEEA